MEPDTQNISPTSDVEQIKSDLKNLYTHVGSALGKKTDEAKIKWAETRVVLEAKKAALDERAAQLTKAGSAASGDLKSGFSAAFSELKKAFADAKAKFDTDEQ
jgi:ElaB/YqjD/DUF883 family membrane-anchored ribosome-binding protein